MTNRRIATVGLWLLAIVLWVPAGQQEFLLEHWMKVGTIAAPMLLLVGFSFRDGKRRVLEDPQAMALLMLVCYLVHQHEEHWVDLLGHRYAFHASVNQLVNGLLGPRSPAVQPLTPEAIFVINTALVWVPGALAILRSPVHRFPVLAMAGIVLVNALTHIVSALLMRAYNPGLLTAVVMFLPLAGFVYGHAMRREPWLKPQIIASLAWAVGAHALMVGGMLAANWFEWVPQWLWFATLVAWGLMPAVLFAGRRPASVGAQGAAHA